MSMTFRNLREGSVSRMAAAVALIATSGASHALLVDRGGGLIYDTVLDVTWLQDANYAHTQGVPGLGQMTWADAMAWADQLNYFDSVRGVTWSNWRLPSIKPLNGVAFQFGTSTGGNTDDGYNISAPGTPYAGSTASELAYMYYNNLGNVARCPITGWAFCSTDPVSLNAGPFLNLFAAGYWFNSDEDLPFAPPDAWAFDMGDAYGAQGGFNGQQHRGAWAVMDGDVGRSVDNQVSEPSSLALLAAASVLALHALRRRHPTDRRKALHTT